MLRVDDVAIRGIGRFRRGAWCTAEWLDRGQTPGKLTAEMLDNVNEGMYGLNWTRRLVIGVILVMEPENLRLRRPTRNSKAA